MGSQKSCKDSTKNSDRPLSSLFALMLSSDWVYVSKLKKPASVNYFEVNSRLFSDLFSFYPNILFVFQIQSRHHIRSVWRTVRSLNLNTYINFFCLISTSVVFLIFFFSFGRLTFISHFSSLILILCNIYISQFTNLIF